LCLNDEDPDRTSGSSYLGPFYLYSVLSAETACVSLFRRLQSGLHTHNSMVLLPWEMA
jgi:hypothetical protein